MSQSRKSVERSDEAAAKAPNRTAGADSAATAGADGDSAELSFEASLERLEGVVDRLERGELELEESLTAFEEGVRLSARCAEQLADAEQRIELLMQQGGDWVSRPFDPVDPVDAAAEASGEDAS